MASWTPPRTLRSHLEVHANTNIFDNPIPAPNLLGGGTPERRGHSQVEHHHGPEVTLGYRGRYQYFGLGDTETQQGSVQEDLDDVACEGSSAHTEYLPKREEDFWAPLEIVRKGLPCSDTAPGSSTRSSTYAIRGPATSLWPLGTSSNMAALPVSVEVGAATLKVKNNACGCKTSESTLQSMAGAAHITIILLRFLLVAVAHLHPIHFDDVPALLVLVEHPPDELLHRDVLWIRARRSVLASLRAADTFRAFRAADAFNRAAQ
ncbi:hypothetical protein OF83DRAFT_1178728 [Amylostereum chailletii]|nr:hypothetical protein OF83DRAFT_1178728 [Amylostereum chailletii]